MSEMLKKARAYEAEKAAQTDKKYQTVVSYLGTCRMDQ